MTELSTGRKLAYAMGGLAMNLTNLIVAQWILVRYVPSPEKALVPAGLFATLFLLGRITDGITDPLVGFWSDRLRSKRGRRIPFILWGLIPFALVFGLLWTPPMAEQHWLNVVYALVMIQAFFVLYTVVVTPYLALLPEITREPRQRVNLTTLQAVFVLIGTAIFAAIGIVIDAGGWLALAGLGATLTVVSFAPTLLAIRETPRPAGPEPAADAPASTPLRDLFHWMALTLRNRPFLHLVSATACYWFGLNLLVMLVPYWVSDRLSLEEGAVTIVMGPFLAMNAVCFVIFNVAAKRWGKFPTFAVAILLSAVTAPLLAAVGHLPFGSELAQTAVVMGLIGIPVAGFMMLPFALLADVVDHDEELTGQRREAIYFGVQAILQKTMIGVSITVFSWMVLTGGGETVDLGGLTRIPFVAAGAFVLGLVAFAGYSLREKVTPAE